MKHSKGNSQQIAWAYGVASDALSASLSAGAFIWGGWYLDQQWKSAPWMILCGVAAGSLGFGFSLRRILQRLDAAPNPRPRPSQDNKQDVNPARDCKKPS